MPPAPRCSESPRRRTAAWVTLVVACLLAGLMARPSFAAANPPGPHDPMGYVDAVTTPDVGQVEARGWAADPDASSSPVTVLGLLDGSVVSSTVTTISRPDVVRALHTGPRTGFDLTVQVPTGAHTVCIVARNLGPGTDRVLRCVTTPIGSALSAGQLATHSPRGTMTATVANGQGIRVAGQSWDPDDPALPLTVVVYLDGMSAATVSTGAHAGFAVTVPAVPGAHLACVWSVNVGLGSNSLLGCAAVDTRGPAGSGAVATPALNLRVVAEANRHLGQPYVWGAAGPKTFDCSGLVQYSYRVAGLSTPRIAAAQFQAARLIPAARAVPGDLVFYHDSTGAVYHVGIYLGSGMTDAAVDPAEGVRHQQVWDPTATYGSFTHT